MNITTANARLQEHYDLKYASADAMQVQATPLVKAPHDRFEQAVYLASREARGRLLEVGAGSGAVLMALLDSYDHLTATDISAARVEELGKISKAGRGVTALRNNIENESEVFRDNSFDTIVMVAVIEHFFDPVGVLQELHRILKPGGRLILDTPNIAKWTRRVKLAFGFFPSTASLDEGLKRYEGGKTDLHDEGHLHYFTFRSLRRIGIERAGFSRAESFGYGSALARLWPPLFSEISMVFYKIA